MGKSNLHKMEVVEDEMLNRWVGKLCCVKIDSIL